jgi:hypothetical protein
MLINHSVGDCRPDISIFKDEEYLVAIELMNITRVNGQIRSYDQSIVKSSIEKLKLCASNYQRGYLIHIDENDLGYKDSFAQWKDDYYRNLWYEVEGSRAYIFEVKKGRTNKRGV